MLSEKESRPILKVDTVKNKKIKIPIINNLNNNSLVVPSKNLRTTFSDIKQLKKISKIGYSNTISSKYDAFNIDESWICIFCKKRSHDSNLGDLFGPYFLSKIISFQCKMSNIEKLERKNNKIFTECPTKKNKDGIVTEEVWFHEDCIIWTPNIYLLGAKLINLEETIIDSMEKICSNCNQAGATLNCMKKQCNNIYHYPCAESLGCSFHRSSFQLYCAEHKLC